jgi:hypothetical protein
VKALCAQALQRKRQAYIQAAERIGDGAVHDAKSYRKVAKPGLRLSGGGGCTRRRSSWIADRTLIGTSWQ